MDALLARILDTTLVPPGAATLGTWWEATLPRRSAWRETAERALVGGACADRIGFAFAGGYAEALRALVPDGPATLTALCATEEGGNQPRAIKTTLTPAGPGAYTLSGVKKWATAASEAAALLVVASVGVDAGGKNRLRVVRVPVGAPGVRLHASSAPFIPEVPHASVELDGVAVTEADLLPGDGYDDYLKPFRTVEDLHVHAALAGYLVGVLRRRDLARELVQPLLAVAVATVALARADAKAASTHLALAGLLELFGRLVADVERAWSAAPDDEWQRWQRDRSILQVAGAARTARRERAWTALEAAR